MTITLGWWLLPLVITIVAVLLSIFCAPKDSQRNANMFSATVGAAFDGFVGLLLFFFAIIVSLVSWLIYALVT